MVPDPHLEEIRHRSMQQSVCAAGAEGKTRRGVESLNAEK